MQSNNILTRLHKDEKEYSEREMLLTYSLNVHKALKRTHSATNFLRSVGLVRCIFTVVRSLNLFPFPYLLSPVSVFICRQNSFTLGTALVVSQKQRNESIEKYDGLKMQS